MTLWKAPYVAVNHGIVNDSFGSTPATAAGTTAPTIAIPRTSTTASIPVPTSLIDCWYYDRGCDDFAIFMWQKWMDWTDLRTTWQLHCVPRYRLAKLPSRKYFWIMNILAVTVMMTTNMLLSSCHRTCPTRDVGSFSSVYPKKGEEITIFHVQIQKQHSFANWLPHSKTLHSF